MRHRKLGSAHADAVIMIREEADRPDIYIGDLCLGADEEETFEIVLIFSASSAEKVTVADINDHLAAFENMIRAGNR